MKLRLDVDEQELKKKDEVWCVATFATDVKKKIAGGKKRQLEQGKKALADANTDLDVRKEDLALAKEAFDLEKLNWTRATKAVAKAMMNDRYLAQAQANYKNRENEFS